MFVRDWMTRKVVTVGPDDALLDAARLLGEAEIKHLPVVKSGKLVGMISDRDIKEALPSKATGLDIYELHYLLDKTRVRDIMKKRVFTASPDMPIEEASRELCDRKVGCLPVVEGGALAGILSDQDIYRALVDITGVRHGGHRIAVELADRPGSIKELADIVRKHGFHLTSILTSYEGARSGHRKVVLRVRGSGDFRAMKGELTGEYKGVEIRKG